MAAKQLGRSVIHGGRIFTPETPADLVPKEVFERDEAIRKAQEQKRAPTSSPLVTGATGGAGAAADVDKPGGPDPKDVQRRLAGGGTAAGAGTGAFPADFPGADLLAENGYANVDAVRAASDDDLLAIDGIGKGTLEKIRKAQG